MIPISPRRSFSTFASAVALCVTLAPAIAAQQGSNPPAPAGASTFVIVPDTLTTMPRTLSEMLRDYVPSASVQRSTGALGASAWVSLRDASVVRGDDPLVVIDGIRQVNYRSSLDTMTIRRAPSILDDVMVEDIAQVEVLNGPAAAALYGYDGQHGVIAVTMRPTGNGRPVFRANVVTTAADANPDYTRNLSRVTATGRPCPYFHELAGLCTPTGTSRYTPLLDHGPFQSAQQARAHLGANGGIGIVGYAASLGFDRGTGTMETDATDRTAASLRLRLPIASSMHLALTSLAEERGISLPSEGSSSVLAWGAGGGPFDCSRATPCGSDSTSNGYGFAPLDFLEQQRSRRRIRHFGQSITFDIAPSAVLSLRTTATGELLRDKASMRDSSPPGYPASQGRSLAAERNWRVGGSQEARLHTALGPASATTLISVRFDAERSRDQYDFVRGEPTSYVAGYSEGHSLRRDRLEVALDQRFAWSNRGSFGIGAARTTTRMYHRGMSAVADPHADVAFQLLHPSAPLGALASFRLRGAVAQASGHDLRGLVDGRIFRLIGPPLPTGYEPATPKFQPDRSLEFEGGFDAGFSVADSRLSVTAFRRNETVRGAFLVYAASSDANPYAKRYVSGTELTADATPIALERTRLHLRGQLAVTHDRLGKSTMFPLVGYSGSVAGAYLALADGESWGAWRTRGYIWNDANGDGRIEAGEVSAGGPAEFRRSRPSVLASLASSLTVGRAWTVAATIDHVGGFDVYDQLTVYQCRDLVCPALNQPDASLAEQARAVAAATGVTTTGYLVPGDATRLREISLTCNSSRAATMINATSLQLSLVAYDVVTWSRTAGIRPETSIPAPGDRGTAAWSLVQPIPRTLGLRVALVY